MRDVMGTGVEVRRREAAAWALRVLPAYVAHLLGVVAVVYAIRSRSMLWLVVAGAYLALATVVLEARHNREWRRRQGVAVLLRAGLAGVQLLVGVVLVWLRPNEALSFVGVTSLLLVASTARAEVRRSQLGQHVRGPLLFVLAGVLVALGLGPIGAVDAMAGLALAGIGLVVAGAGVELSTEDWTRRGSQWSSRAMHRRGLLLIVVIIAAVTVVGGEAGYLFVALVGFIVVALVVLVAASDSDGVEIIALLVVALIWAAAPRDVAEDPGLAPVPGEPWFLALGDSYISGEGAGRYFEGTNDRRANECRRAPSAHPVLLADADLPGVPDRLLFLACSGALAVDLHGERPGRTEPRPQLELLAEAVEGADLDLDDLAFVLVSLGGNDAGFGDIGAACVLPGNCAAIGHRFLEGLGRVGDRLDVAYGELADALPDDTRVLVVPYPVPLADRGCWWSSLTDAEVRFITAFVGRLNQVVMATAEAHDFEVVSPVADALAGAGLRVCDGNRPWGSGMNFIGLNPTSGDLVDVLHPRGWIHNSLHPNERGHRAMFAAIAGWLADPEASGATGVDRAALSFPGGVVDCAVDDPPGLCDQSTSQWQDAQLLAMARRGVWFAVPMALACWLLIAPTVRARVVRGTPSPGAWLLRRIHATVAWLWIRLRRPERTS